MAKEIEFSRLVAQVAANFDEMQNGDGVLYVTNQSNIGNQPLFDTWLDSFKEQKKFSLTRKQQLNQSLNLKLF